MGFGVWGGGGGVSNWIDLFGSARNQSLPGHAGTISGDIL